MIRYLVAMQEDKVRPSFLEQFIRAVIFTFQMVAAYFLMM